MSGALDQSRSEAEVVRGRSVTSADALVVMDQSMLVKLIALALNHGHFSVRAVGGVLEATTLLATWHPDLVLVDMDVEEGELMSWLADHAPDLGRPPVIALTRRGDLRTKLVAFERGADDILTVPFSPEELLARALALMRRTGRGSTGLAPVIQVGDLKMDILNRSAWAGTAQLHLTSLEQSLLYLLAANSDRVVTREEILDTLWGVDFVAESNVVDRHVRNLRAKLQNGWRHPRFIATVPGQGYRFVGSVAGTAPA